MSLAKSYARALYEASAEQRDRKVSADELESQLRDFAQLLTANKEMRVALLGGSSSAKERMAVVSDLAQRAGFLPIFKNFLGLLARKGRMSLIDDIVASFGAVRLEAEGGILGKLVSAEPLDSADVDGLAAAFTKKLGKRVAFTVSTDASLLAGMRVTVNGVTYDGTLRSQLAQLRDRFIHSSEAAH